MNKNYSAEDLLEELGETVERVRRNSIKVVATNNSGFSGKCEKED